MPFSKFISSAKPYRSVHSFFVFPYLEQFRNRWKIPAFLVARSVDMTFALFCIVFCKVECRVKAFSFRIIKRSSCRIPISDFVVRKILSPRRKACTDLFKVIASVGISFKSVFTDIAVLWNILSV